MILAILFCLAFQLPCAYQQCTERPKVTDCQSTQLYHGGRLQPGEYLESPSRRYRFIHECNGWITFKDTTNRQVLYSAKPTPDIAAPSFLLVQHDGNVVQYTATGVPTWDSGTDGQCTLPYWTVLEVQDTPNVVVACDGRPMTWAAVPENERLNTRNRSTCTITTKMPMTTTMVNNTTSITETGDEPTATTSTSTTTSTGDASTATEPTTTASTANDTRTCYSD